MEKEAVTSGKRKAESSEAPAALGCAELAGEVPAAADAMLAPAAGESFVDEATGIKYIEMPENYLCWILSQKRLSPAPYDPMECSGMMSQEEIERELAAIYGEARGLGSGCEGSSSPPDLGGLGIVDLQKFGFALRMRWLWLRRVDPSRPWFCLPDEKEGVVELMFQASIYVVLGDGNAALFWSDRWLDGQS